MFVTQGTKVVSSRPMTVDELYKIICDRKQKMPLNSYVSALLRGGKDQIIQKVGEETTEVIIAAKNETKKRIISEIADLWFHLLILMVQFNIAPQNILDELEKRRK